MNDEVQRCRRGRQIALIWVLQTGMFFAGDNLAIVLVTTTGFSLLIGIAESQHQDRLERDDSREQ